MTKREKLETTFECKLDTEWATKKVLKDKGYFNPEDLELAEHKVVIVANDLTYESDALNFKAQVLDDYEFLTWLGLPEPLHDYIDFEITDSTISLYVWEQDYAENQLGQEVLTDEQETEISDDIFVAESKFESYYKSTQERFKIDIEYYMSDEYLDDVIKDL